MIDSKFAFIEHSTIYGSWESKIIIILFFILTVLSATAGVHSKTMSYDALSLLSTFLLAPTGALYVMMYHYYWMLIGADADALSKKEGKNADMRISSGRGRWGVIISS